MSVVSLPRQAGVTFEPSAWPTSWALAVPGAPPPPVTVRISDYPGPNNPPFDVCAAALNTIKLNGTVAALDKSCSTTTPHVLTVHFPATPAINSLGTLIPGKIYQPAVEGTLSASQYYFGQGPVSISQQANDLMIQADQHIVGTGKLPVDKKVPIVGMETRAYGKACLSGLGYSASWQNYEAIWNDTAHLGTNACRFDPNTQYMTDSNGQVRFPLVAGDYIVIGDATSANPSIKTPSGGSVFPGVSAGGITTGSLTTKYLQVITRADGTTVPAKYTEKTGSTLLLIEPEFIEWASTTELYPFVFQSVGDWEVATSVAPPEGFVADYPVLSTTVNNGLVAVQFTVTDVGSKWVSTDVSQEVRHNGKVEKIKSKVGIMLTPELAKKKKKSVYGDEPPPELKLKENP